MNTNNSSKYIVFPQKEKVEVREETVSAPGPGEILCEAQKSLVSIGTEMYCLRGEFDPGTNWADWVKYPFRPGYSMAARVVEVGKDVTGFKVGDRIATYTTHQKFTKVPAKECYLLTEGVSDEDATWRSLACTTQLGVRRAQLQLGESVGVVGLGMLGQLVVQYLAASGARRVVAIDTVEGRLQMAKAHGATHILSSDVRNAVEPIKEITNGRMLDVIFDITGHPAVLAPAIQLVRRLGRVVLLGDTPTPTQQHLGPGVVSNSIAILGIHGYMMPAQYSEFAPWTAQEMSDLFFDYLMQGRMRVSDLITHRYSPDEAPQVYQMLRQDRSKAVGIVFDWNKLAS